MLSAYFLYPAVSEAIHAKYLAIHNRLLQEQLTAADYAAIENALLFLAPIYRSEQEDHRSIMSTILKYLAFMWKTSNPKRFFPGMFQDQSEFPVADSPAGFAHTK